MREVIILKKTIVFGIIFLFLIVSVSPLIISIRSEKSNPLISYGTVLYVGGTEEGNYSMIQNAIDNASNGDTVFVYDESSPYYENVVVDKSINLIGENKNTTVINGNESGSVIVIYADFVNIRGFTIQNCSYGVDYAGIKINSNHNIIIDNIISLNDAYASAILITDYRYNINNNTIIKNDIISNKGYGIYLWYYSNNTTITENNISNNDIGIVISQFSTNNTVINNNISSNKRDGIHLSNQYGGSANNTISGNNIIANNENGIKIKYSIGNTITGNIISLNNEDGIYIGSESISNIITSNDIISNNGFGIFLSGSYKTSKNNIIEYNNIISNNKNGIKIESNGNLITGNKIISSNSDGIFFSDYHGYCYNNTISYNNIISNNGFGVYCDSNSNTFIGNNILNNSHGIYLKFSYDNIITGNNILNNSYGVSLSDSCNNFITENSIFNSSYGISIKYYSSGNIITGNNIISNYYYGIQLNDVDSSNNIFYHNNFIDNTDNAIDKADNIWDNGYPRGGNYWDDYMGVDADADGIGDTPYPIPGVNNEDRYPFMNPNGWTNIRPNPPIITGPTNGIKRIYYEYIFSISDPDGDSLWIHIDWEHGTPSKWDGPFPSESIVKYNYSWRKKGTYTIRAQTMDSKGLLSAWGKLEITIPRARVDTDWYYRLLERLPMLERLLEFLKIIRCLYI